MSRLVLNGQGSTKEANAVTYGQAVSRSTKGARSQATSAEERESTCWSVLKGEGGINTVSVKRRLRTADCILQTWGKTQTAEFLTESCYRELTVNKLA